MAMKSECSKCGGAMVEGFVFDRGQSLKLQQVWVEGKPEESFWKGLKTSGRATYNVRAARCAECGFLEFYASEKSDLGKFSEIFT